MHWACLLLPQLAIDGVLRRHPEPDAPLVLIRGPAQRRVLHAVSPAARALGLRPGMSLAAAQALSTAFATVEHDPEETERWRQLLAAWAYRFISQVSTDLPHALVLEVGRAALRAQGLDIDPLPLPDHHAFDTLPWPPGTPDVVVTEKDAVKLRHAVLGATRLWVAPLDLVPEPGFMATVQRHFPPPATP